MIKPKYLITTPYGDRYELDELGCVLTYSGNGLDKSNATRLELASWQVLGLVELKPFGNLGQLIPLEEAVKLESTKFKNGKPKYTAMDRDHGTKRIWGNTQVHGIASIRKV